MSRKRNNSENSEESYDTIIESLVRENNNLKKKIGKLRKMATKALESEEDEESYEEETKIVENTSRKKKSGSCFCGGDFQRVVLLNIVFDVCQTCKRRVKVVNTEK